MSIAEKVYEVVKTLPDQQAQQVLNFADFLKDRAQNAGLKPRMMNQRRA